MTLETFVKENKGWLVLVALAFLLGGPGMQMLTGDSSVSCKVGDTVKIPFQFVYNEDFFFGTTSSAHVNLKYYIVDSTGSSQLQWENTIWQNGVVVDQVYTGSYSFKPEVAGDHKLRFEYFPSGTTSAGNFDVNVHADPVADSGTGETETGGNELTMPSFSFTQSVLDYLEMLLAWIMGIFGGSAA